MRLLPQVARAKIAAPMAGLRSALLLTTTAATMAATLLLPTQSRAEDERGRTASATTTMSASLSLPPCKAPWLEPEALRGLLQIELRERGIATLTLSAATDPPPSTRTLRLAVEVTNCKDARQAFLALRLGSRELSQVVDLGDVSPGARPRTIAMLFGTLIDRLLANGLPADDAPPPTSTQATVEVAARVPGPVTLGVGASSAYSFSGTNWLWGGQVDFSLGLTKAWQLQARTDFLGTQAPDPLGAINVLMLLEDVSLAWVPIQRPVVLDIALGPWVGFVWGKGHPSDPLLVALTTFRVVAAAALKLRVSFPVGEWLPFIELAPAIMLAGLEFTADTRVPFSMRNVVLQLRVGVRWRPSVPPASLPYSD